MFLSLVGLCACRYRQRPHKESRRRSRSASPREAMNPAAASHYTEEPAPPRHAPSHSKSRSMSRSRSRSRSWAGRKSGGRWRADLLSYECDAVCRKLPVFPGLRAADPFGFIKMFLSLFFSQLEYKTLVGVFCGELAAVQMFPLGFWFFFAKLKRSVFAAKTQQVF